jgi:predicted NAD/FAD-dependent oxidoreductase
LVSALGEDPRCVSMAAARKVIIDGFAAARGASDVLVPRKPLAKLFGETLQLYIAELGTKIRLGQVVSRLHVDVSTGTLRSVETSGGARVAAEKVVLATPWSVTSRLIQASELSDAFPLADRWGDMPTSPITGIHLWLDRDIMQDNQVAIVGLLPQWLFRRPVKTENAAGECYYQVVVSASHDVRGLEPTTLVAMVMSDLARVLPEAKQAKVLRSRVVTDPRSVFSITPEVDAIRPDSATAINGLYLAGDWIQTGWPATMEGAVISGLMAANQLFEDKGLAVQPIQRGMVRGWLSRTLVRN